MSNDEGRMFYKTKAMTNICPCSAIGPTVRQKGSDGNEGLNSNGPDSDGRILFATLTGEQQKPTQLQ